MPIYNKTGPFSPGAGGGTPVTHTFLNNVEDWIEGMDAAGVSVDEATGTVTAPKFAFSTGTIKRIARFSSTGTGAAQTLNHGLGETPDIVLFNYAGNFGSPPTHPVYYWNENSTQVNVKADSGYFYYGLAIKF